MQFPLRLISGISSDRVRRVPGCCHLSEEDGQALVRASGVKHASINGLAACLLDALCRECLRDTEINNDAVGLLCTGGPWNSETADTFLRRAFAAGPQFVNPLMFPATLLSATPCSVAAAHSIRGFAYAVGHDELAFFDVLRRGQQFLRAGIVRHVIAAGVAARTPALIKARQAAKLHCDLLDVSIGLAMTVEDNAAIPPIALMDAYIGDQSYHWPHIEQRYDAACQDGTTTFPIALPLLEGDAMSATGAVLCAAAILHEMGRPHYASGDFVVSCTKQERTGAAWFRINYSAFS